MLAQIDQHSPFRKTAPSRSAALQISHADLRTRSGFFSLAVFRGITFGSGFLVDHRQTYFRSLTHFKEVTAPFNNDKSYVANTTAYSSTYVSQRKVENADKYWIAAAEWEEFVKKSGDHISFAKAKAHLEKLHKDHLLTAVGGLTMILILGKCSI